MFFQLRKWFTLLFLTFPLSLGVFSPSHKNSQKRKQKLIFFLLKKTTALHHVLSELLSTFYPCQISLSANSLPSLTFTVFNLDHLWLPPPPCPSFSPTKADLFTFKNNTKNVLLWGLLLSFIESSFLFSLSALWLDENCKKIKNRTVALAISLSPWNPWPTKVGPLEPSL